MKKIVFTMALLSFLMAGKTYAQKNDVLLSYDENAFEKAAKTINPDDYNNKQKYALEVFREYRKKNSVKFTSTDYENYKTGVASLTNEKNQLQKDKKNLQDELSEEKGNNERIKKEKKTMQRQIDSLQEQNTKLQKSLKDLPAKEQKIEKLEGDIKGLNTLIATLTEQKRELEINKAQLESQINSFDTEKERIEKQRDDAIEAKGNVEAQLAGLQQQIFSKDERIRQLESSIALKEGENAKYKNASKEAKTTINNTYENNVKKPIVEMNLNQLDEARSSFEGMKALLAIDPEYKELERKVGEIASWRVLAGPMQEAKQYLKGKYDDQRRKECIVALSKVSIKGSKDADRQAMMMYLKDQAQLYDNYQTIIKILEDYGCLPTNELLSEANEKLNIMTLNNSFYHESIYDSYDRGISIMKSELSKTSPSNRVKNQTVFEEFIKELKGIF